MNTNGVTPYEAECGCYLRVNTGGIDERRCAAHARESFEKMVHARQSGATGMSETTTYRVVTEPPDAYPRVFGPGWDVLVRPDVYPAQRAAAIALAERIARLLTEEDERIERAAMFARAVNATPEYTYPPTKRRLAADAWVQACESQPPKPLAELRALEAAYLAAKEQDR